MYGNLKYDCMGIRPRRERAKATKDMSLSVHHRKRENSKLDEHEVGKVLSDNDIQSKGSRYMS